MSLLNKPCMFVVVIGIVMILWSTECQGYRYSLKTHEKCDDWAKEGECLNNPNFMWTSCHDSCMFGPTAMQDVDAECPGWALEGECSANPVYIHLHCPKSCNQAIGWSPWARDQAGVERFLPFNEDAAKECGLPRGVFTAAELMRNRLETYLSGGASSVRGLSSTAPTEYLGMLGLAEAFLYTARLYRVVIDHNIEDNYKSPEALNATGLVNDFIKSVEDIISQGYESDLLMRMLPTWQAPLGAISTAVTAMATRSSSRISPEEICLNNYGPYPYIVRSLNPTRSFRMPDFQARNGILKLNNGLTIPAIGLGTWQLNGAECEEVVEEAIRLGYRHIDSAEAYGNEVDIGWAVHHAIQKGLVTREELFLATKLSDERNGGAERTRRLVQQQLANLKTDYIDLYMLHSPFRDFLLQVETWRTLEEFVDAGVIRTLGVSNFDGQELRKLVSRARILPAVLQNKIDVYHIGKQLDNKGDDVIFFAHTKDIVPVAYSPFSSYPFSMEPVDDPIVGWIAKQHKATPAQVILRWLGHKGFASIPRSSSTANLAGNLQALDVISLTDDEITLMNSIQYLVASPVSKVVKA